MLRFKRDNRELGGCVVVFDLFQQATFCAETLHDVKCVPLGWVLKREVVVVVVVVQRGIVAVAEVVLELGPSCCLSFLGLPTKVAVVLVGSDLAVQFIERGGRGSGQVAAAHGAALEIQSCCCWACLCSMSLSRGLNSIW